MSFYTASQIDNPQNISHVVLLVIILGFVCGISCGDLLFGLTHLLTSVVNW